MGFFKDASGYLFKYSEKLVNKTEEYSKIAKLNVDIKRIESNINKIHVAIGEFIIKKVEEGATDLTLGDAFIREQSNKIKEMKDSIQAKRDEIAEVKQRSAEKIKGTTE